MREPTGISLQSSLLDIDAALRAVGVLHPTNTESSYVQDWHFERYVLTSLSDMDAVEQFLVKLDEDCRVEVPDWKQSGCTKAYVARSWISTGSSQLPPLNWAIFAISRARRTSCSCHTTGSFHRFSR